MADETNYWIRRRISRRAALRGAAAGIAGIAGAALIGCGRDDDDTAATSGGPSQQGQQQPTASATAEAAGSPMPAGRIRIPGGFYDNPIPPTPAELNPAVNGRYGGKLVGYYLDPPTMDINRMLSCTVYHTMQYTQNKLVAGKTGATAHPFIVEIEPDLAESWEPSPDNTEFTFHLRTGVKTHNVDPTFGREYTSEDVKKSIERYQAGGTQMDVWAPVTAIETPDDYTVRFTLDQPLVDFPTNIASWSFMWVKELIEDDTLQERAVGTGAFIQDDWVKKEHSRFVRHPDYFEAGLPFIDEILTIVYDRDPSLRREAFLTDGIFEWGARDDVDARDMLSRVDDAVVWKYPRSRGANVNGFHFQMDNPMFQDVRVRRAFSLAFDRDEYDRADNAGDNQGPEGAFSNPPMPWSMLYDEYPTAKANGRWYQFDPQEASRLMEAAGYTADSPMKWEIISYYSDADFSEIVIPGVLANLPQMDISFREVDKPTHVTLLANGNFDDGIGIVRGPAGFSMDQWIYPWWHSRGGLNFNNVNDPAMDKLLEDQRDESDPEAKQAIWQQVWDHIHDQVWDIWWPEAFNRSAWHNYAINYRPHGLMGGFLCYTGNNVKSMWLDAGAPTA